MINVTTFEIEEAEDREVPVRVEFECHNASEDVIDEIRFDALFYSGDGSPIASSSDYEEVELEPLDSEVLGIDAYLPEVLVPSSTDDLYVQVFAQMLARSRAELEAIELETGDQVTSVSRKLGIRSLSDLAGIQVYMIENGGASDLEVLVAFSNQSDFFLEDLSIEASLIASSGEEIDMGTCTVNLSPGKPCIAELSMMDIQPSNLSGAKLNIAISVLEEAQVEISKSAKVS